MPKYHYRCQSCENEFDIYHSMSQKMTYCDECDLENSLVRVPSFFTTKENRVNNTVKVGSIVNKHIEDVRREVEEEKREMKKEREF